MLTLEDFTDTRICSQFVWGTYRRVMCSEDIRTIIGVQSHTFRAGLGGQVTSGQYIPRSIASYEVQQLLECSAITPGDTLLRAISEYTHFLL